MEIRLIKYWSTKERRGERNTKEGRKVNEGGSGSGQSPLGKGSEENVDFSIRAYVPLETKERA
jgi:hypothetical protein